MGKVKGTRSPTPGSEHGGRGALLRKSKAPARFPEAGRKGPAAPPPLGLEKLMQSWAERNQNRNWQHGVLRGRGAGEGNLYPCEGKGGRVEEALGVQRMGQPFRRLFFRTCRPARVAISNTSRTPSLVLAEHSR